MNIHFVKAFLGLIAATTLFTVVSAQPNSAPTSNKPMVIDAAVVDNS